jgi:hypothetical protein
MSGAKPGGGICRERDPVGNAEACSPGPYLELFARGTRKGWAAWGDQSQQATDPF